MSTAIAMAFGAGAARRPPFLRRDVAALSTSLQAAGDVGCLAVVTGAEGSTYSKPGGLMLFAVDGRQAGLLSGGCLETDLAERAARVMRTGVAEVVHYDARDVEQDVLFGLALGCEGVLRIHLLPVGLAQGFEPLCSLQRAASRGESCRWGLVTRGQRSGTVLLAPSPGLAAAGWSLPGGHAALVADPLADEEQLWLRMAPPPHLLLCGAGAEAPALATGALALGWEVTVLDHRSAWADPARFPAGVAVRCHDPRGVSSSVLVAEVAVVMAHHLEVDAAWLAALAATGTPWIGLLGPPARRARLLDRLGRQASTLAGRLQGPVGLPIGARTPEEIALSILAAAQQAVAALA